MQEVWKIQESIVMQYILTLEEYDNLVPKSELNKAREKIDILNDKVLELSGFSCIYENKSVFSYCDKCPLNSFRDGTGTCRKVKSYSK